MVTPVACIRMLLLLQGVGEGMNDFANVEGPVSSVDPGELDKCITGHKTSLASWVSIGSINSDS